MLARWLSLVFFTLSALLPLWSRAEVPIPTLTGWVIDQTATLTAEQKNSLERSLQAFVTRKGSQLSVVIVASTQPETIEQYSLRLVERWKLGRKNIDDGVLLIIAKNDRSLRIEVGYGLEGALNDAICKRIISETITPYFKQGDFYGGIAAGVLQILRVIDGENLPPTAANGVQTSVNMHEYIFGLFMLALVMGAILRRFLGGLIGAMVTGGIIALLAWLLIGVLTIAVFAGFFAILLTWFGGTAWGALLLSRFGGGGRGGGFGGGRGGGFGGGGASGKW